MRQTRTAPRQSDSEADIAFAERLFHDSGDDLRFVPGVGWHEWDGTRFRPDATFQIVKRAEETVRRIHLDAYREPNSDRRDKLAKLASQYSRIERVRGALEFLKPRLTIGIDNLDPDPFSFNVRNGTIDLRTGELRPHNRADRITKLSPIEYQPDAEASRWRQFLEEIFAGESDLVGYVQRLFGRALTADQRDHVLAFLCGLGSNGKTVLTRIMLAAAGEYGQVAPESIFMRKYGDAIPVDVARLRGARLVIASESQEAQHLDEGKIKALTGSGKITARFMRQNLFEFEPTHHLFLQTNHRPRIVGQDTGIWRRIRLINFGVRFDDPCEAPDTEHPKDLALEEKLMAELPGVLAWAVGGSVEWFNNGLQDPATIIDDTKAYRREEDVLADFIESKCVVDPNLQVDIGALWTVYRGWCETEGTKPWSKNRFSRRLTDAGHPSDRESARTKTGIGIKELNQ